MLNKAILMGRLTGEPELRHTQNGTPVCSFTLAVKRSFGKDDESDFIDVVAWQKAAEFVARYFHKGMLVAAEGRIQTRSYEDKQGSKRKVVAEGVHFAEGKKGGAPQGGNIASGRELRELVMDDSELPF